MPKKIKTTAPPGSSKGITVYLKSARNPVMDIKLGNVALATATVQELKEAVHQRIRPTNLTDADQRVPLDKIKLLWKRKPVQGTSIADILANESDIVSGKSHAEFSVMILGGATVIPEEELKAAAATSKSTQPIVPGTQEDTEMKDVEDVKESIPDAGSQPSKAGALETPQFWEELEVFLQEKTGDKSEAARLGAMFKTAWQSSL
ncbi:uncharacterized protein GIQ15_06587 [Arthroderma uncinatum]|uniref:uncharacterized protein n=1 Tax=Arthroderma uncinatum TaxID=74035 RepID=UPI00144A6611|nr:uncharacterized protein GIQ15_06587 [Arthroderma uncinatum]KAF3479611.1 hypothetical protein GIQ15_06587 [Arthroderma uncinatum]